MNILQQVMAWMLEKCREEQDVGELVHLAQRYFGVKPHTAKSKCLDVLLGTKELRLIKNQYFVIRTDVLRQ